MYKVYLDKQLIHDLDSEDNVLVNPTLELELNKAGTFTFSMECTHPYYDKLERFKSIIQVLCDGDEIFKGRIIEITDDMYKERTVYCESELAYLNDTIQRPYEYHLAANAVVEYLTAVIGSHNEQVEAEKQFTIGMVTITDPNDYIYCYTNYNSTMDEIKEDLVDDLGGYIRIRNDYKNNDPLGELNVTTRSNGRFIDYIKLEDYGNTSTQYIQFGENLLDFSNDINQADICTGIIPLGATLDESEYSAIEERVTIESVNSGSDYLVIPEAVEKYGLILKVVTWDDITDPGNLKTAAENYLAEYDYEPQTITATAVDLSLVTPAEVSQETLTARETLEAYDTVVYTLTAGNTITEIISYEVTDRDDTGYASITRISFSGKTVSVTVDNSSKTEDLDITITVVVATTKAVESWRLGDMIFVESEPHDLHKRYPLAQMTIPLDQPENTSVTLGTYQDTSLSARTNKTESGLRNMEDFTTGNIIASAVAQATNILNGAIHGYVTLNLDDDGHPYELLIMDTEDTETATKVWRWNMGGLGYSSTGYQKADSAYTTAITMDGHILGTLIIANGMVLADDASATFGHFDSEGMKIYQQAGKSDNLSLAITMSGMTVYGGNRTTEFTDGAVVFTYGGKEEGRLYAPGGFDGVWFELGGELEIFGDNVLIGKNDETDTRVLRVENSKGTINLGVSAGGSAGLYFSSLDTWLLQYEIGNAGTIHIGGATDWVGAISLAGNTTVHGTLATSGAVTAGASSSVTGTLTVSGNITSNGNNVLTTASSKPIRFTSDYGNTTVTIPLTTATTDVSLSPLFSGIATSSDVSSVSDSLNQFENDVSNNYALKSDIPTVPSNVSAFTNDAGYITSDQYATLRVWDTNNSGYTNVPLYFGATATLRLNGLVSGSSGGFVTNNEDSATWQTYQGETMALDSSGLVYGDTRVAYFWGGGVWGFGNVNTSSEWHYGGKIVGVGVDLGGNKSDSVTISASGEIDIFAQTIYFNGDVIHGSDQRLKTSIQPLNTSALDNLTPVSFKWRDGDDRTHYGYIAQEVQPYMPELVSEGTDGMLGLAYTEIIPLLHCKIKEQQSKIESLEERIARLEALINEHT